MTLVVADAAAVYTLRVADDCLVLSHRLAQWSSLAPTLEDDIALTNIALDLLGQARAMYARTAELDGTGRSEDDYVFLRDEREFVNCLLVEQENGDFAMTIVRQLLCSTFHLAQWQALERSTDEQVAAIAAKAVKESTYHRDHATDWTMRLGDGTDESHQRMETALATLCPYTTELFETDDVNRDVVARRIAPDPAILGLEWEAYIDKVLSAATLQRPEGTWTPTGGRRGLHTEPFGYMVAEMQHLHRSHPGQTW
ncbi:MAG TPA: 1,2-phenylacetyl-CoA epoxidase subunit PaaC [Candidatus Saccharimonadales bacterium]|nr:1,2-phenylacetyl-CoA epoxidase subunit PaaC [Candidatus Saccharimonadales bacterium]